MPKTTTVTKAQATKALNALKRQQRAYIGAGYPPPTLVTNWDWLGTGTSAKYSIVWEEGPYEWAYLFPTGGVDQEFGFTVAAVDLPDGLYAEPVTSWAVGLYSTDW
jgi:hypothetical protein